MYFVKSLYFVSTMIAAPTLCACPRLHVDIVMNGGAVIMDFSCFFRGNDTVTLCVVFPFTPLTLCVCDAL